MLNVAFHELNVCFPWECRVQFWPRVFCWGGCMVGNTSSPPFPAQMMRLGKGPPRAGLGNRIGNWKGAGGPGWVPASLPVEASLRRGKRWGNSTAPQSGSAGGAPSPWASAGFWFHSCVCPEETQSIKSGPVWVMKIWIAPPLTPKIRRLYLYLVVSFLSSDSRQKAQDWKRGALATCKAVPDPKGMVWPLILATISNDIYTLLNSHLKCLSKEAILRKSMESLPLYFILLQQTQMRVNEMESPRKVRYTEM